MNYIEKLENDSIYIIREAYSQLENIAFLWSMGKDSTALLWLIRKAFYGKIPFPIIHLDTGYKFKEIYEFRDFYAKEWGLDLIIYSNVNADNVCAYPEKNKLLCCTVRKTYALKELVHQYQLKALLLGIRRDEHGIRAKERTFSIRDEDFEWNYKSQTLELWDQYRTKTIGEEHIRIHPLLSWTELDIWRYIKQENIPVCNLYFAKNNTRYRSIGCETCCQPVKSQADTVDKILKELETTNISERNGRAQDKESDYIMQKLRSLGYM